MVRGTLVLVEVSRLPRPTQPPKQLWLWWAGPGAPDLDGAWRAYVHRCDREHTIRFAKQTLLWATPRVRHPEQADRWTWLVIVASTMLRLARRCARCIGCGNHAMVDLMAHFASSSSVLLAGAYPTSGERCAAQPYSRQPENSDLSRRVCRLRK